MNKYVMNVYIKINKYKNCKNNFKIYKKNYNKNNNQIKIMTNHRIMKKSTIIFIHNINKY